jgi:glucose-6-phosphate 1-epimerase
MLASASDSKRTMRPQALSSLTRIADGNWSSVCNRNHVARLLLPGLLEEGNMTAVLDVQELDRRLGIPDIARVCEGCGGLPRVEITSPLARGEIYVHGAHVTSWHPVSSDEVIFLSTKSRWQEGQAIRGGIPVCFPWFRGKADDPHAPAHGFVRTRSWQLYSIVEDNAGVAVTMFIESDDQTWRWWPGDFRLVHRVTFGSELKLELSCINTGRTMFHFEEALHTYNRVVDVGTVRLEGLDGTRFLDNTDSNKEKTQYGDLTIASQTDNAFINTQNAVDLLDPDMRRRIRLRKANSNTTVVWNPWQEGASKLQDLGEGEWKQFLCVEASNIIGAAVALAPGQEHTMSAVLSVASV